MNSPVTIDASVFISAFSPAESAHASSKAFMSRVREESVPIIVPTLVLPEVASAIARGQDRSELGIAFAAELGHFPNLTLVALDKNLADASAEIAARHRLRGSDAVYAAVAQRFNSLLVTLDQQQSERLNGLLEACSPQAAIKKIE